MYLLNSPDLYIIGMKNYFFGQQKYLIEKVSKMYLFNFSIPLAQGLVCDDLGWRFSSDMTEWGGPPRLNSDHNPVLKDYEDIIRLAKSAGTRIFGAFVMSEWDLEGICAKECYNKPLAPMNITEFGLNWHNSVTEEEKKVFSLIKENSAYIDFALHGVRHGHFEEGKWKSGEWARRAKKDDKGNFCEKIKTVVPWDRENNTDRLIARCYQEILREYFTEEELDFPESFVPPNHAYFYEPQNENTTGAILSEYGVKYCNFKMSGSGAGDYVYFDPVINFDKNLCLLDRRGLKNCSYRKTGATPRIPPRAYAWAEVHFNNLWGKTDHFIKYLYNINRFPQRMLGKNTEQVFSQWIYRNFAKIRNGFSSAILDLRDIPQTVYDRKILSNITLKIFLGRNEIEYINCDGLDVIGYSKDRFGYGYVTLANTENKMGACGRGLYNINYRIGKKSEFSHILTDTTACLYGKEEKEDCICFKVKVYGTQTLKIKSFGKDRVSLESEKCKITDVKKNGDFIEITLKGVSMKGNTAKICLEN